MPIYMSSHAKARMNERFPIIFSGGKINVYSGPQPASADMPPSGTLLATVTSQGGLQFITVGGYASKDPGQVWELQGQADGVAGWFRLLADPLDPGYASEDYARIDGLCWPLVDPHPGLVLPALSITSETLRPIEGFLFSL